jgi:hypothetical protein
MPFGEYKSIRCDNPDCKKLFKPVTSWQTHCTRKCANHAVYLRTVLLKRLEQAIKNGQVPPSVLEKRLKRGLEKLERIKKVAKPEMAGRVARLEARMGSRWKRVRTMLAGLKAVEERLRTEQEQRKVEIETAEKELAALKGEYELKKLEA